MRLNHNTVYLGREVSLIYLVNNGRILFYLRDDKDTIPEPNSWSIFGGVVERGESKEAALERELTEEFTEVVKVTNRGYLGFSQKREQKLYFFKGCIDRLPVDVGITEGQYSRFISPEEIIAGELKFEPAVRDFFMKNKERIL